MTLRFPPGLARTRLARTCLAVPLAASLAAAPLLLGAGPVRAQTKPAAPAAAKAQAPEPGKEVALTQGQIDGLLAAQPELAKLSGAEPDKPDPKAEAQAQDQAEAIVKKNGFASLEAFQDASDTVDTVLSGIDPETKGYVGLVPLLRKQLAAVQADKAMTAEDKAAAVKEIKEALAEGEPAKPSEANVALVTRNYDTLSAAMAGGGEKK